ncbi:hypothetical protein PsorP6_005514 [Peronosclerospora sorghi]|uniref:Uncharacterized protein n=1 Tax=Peronosclerospora sorghi TaxID=230839 RepID=A0ACC0W4M9_9STRA|nr:hypothetical protein PsorP6_005514 [Peronosclerospora sorghi]
MSCSLLLLRRGTPLAATRACATVAPYDYSPRSYAAQDPWRASRARFLVHTRSFAWLSSPRPLVRPMGTTASPRNASAGLERRVQRMYSVGRNPWRPRGQDWKSMLKTGGLVVLGTGALLVSTSLAFGLVLAGAAGFGVYTLYQRFVGPYRSRFRTSRDPFSQLSSNIDTLNDMFSRSRRRRESSAQDDDLNSLVQGLPWVARGLVKTMFSFVGQAMQSSMERAGEVRRRANEYLQANQRVREQVGTDVSVGAPEEWIESTVNGVGRIDAVFPVQGAYNSARVTMKVSVAHGGELEFTELKYRNRHTGDTIDLLRDSSLGGRTKTIIDAEYVDVEKDKSHW